jgi:CHAT domain-containing protein
MLDNKRAFRLKRPQIKVISQDYARQVRGGLDYLSLVAEETDAILNTMEGTSIPTSLPKQKILKEIEEADLIHFALHLFPSDQHQSSSYMVLHQDEDSAFSNLLFDYEIDPLELSTPLVVINACESGSGQFHRGEGMLSLSRSFLLAGAKSVISTLWPVDDKAGSTIMINFYTHLSRGNSKSKALRNAKLSYLEESKPAFSHPYYWAGYQLMGNSSAVYISPKLILTGSAGILLLICFMLWRRKNTLTKV